MRVSTISIFALFMQGFAMSWLRFLPLVLILNEPVEGFFGIFRRREPAPVLKEVPEGPVRFPHNFRGSLFPQGNFFQNNFPLNSFPPRGFGGNPMNNWFSPTSGMQNQPSMQNLPPAQNQPSMHSLPPIQNLPPLQNLPPMQDIEDEQSFDDRDARFDDQPPAINTEEAESFFTLLAETDESKCISRLVCEMGADPKTAGDLGQTVNEIIGSLTDFPPGSKVSEYNEIVRNGRFNGQSFCVSQYSTCDEETYLLMKNNQPDEMSE